MDKHRNAGRYRHRITIRQPAATRDDTGAVIGTGATLDTVWAAKEDWSGSESRENGHETARKTTKFFIRYRTDVLVNMQVVHGTDVYDIESVLDFDGKTRELVLECKRVTS